MKMGFDGFYWFFGVVEDVDDPEKLGRVRISPFGTVAGRSVKPDLLPWAVVGQNPTSAAKDGVGVSPTGIEVGSVAFGFFIDGQAGQLPFVIATYAGKPDGKNDVSELARGINNIQKDRVMFEPQSSYNAQYPHNKTLTTKSGHAIEIDDTPGAERIHVYHKSGSYVEFAPSGDMIIKSTDDSYDLTINNKMIYVGGDTNIVVDGSAQMRVQGSIDITASEISITEQ